MDIYLLFFIGCLFSGVNVASFSYQPFGYAFQRQAFMYGSYLMR
jgi:hypothetical protein